MLAYGLAVGRPHDPLTAVAGDGVPQLDVGREADAVEEFLLRVLPAELAESL